MKRKSYDFSYVCDFVLTETKMKKKEKGIREYVLFLGNVEKIKGFFTLGFHPLDLISTLAFI